MDKKLCSKCEKFAPLTDFNRDRTRADGYHTHCKKCRRARYDANIVELRRKAREGHQKRREYYIKQDRIQNLKRFGLTIESYETLALQQEHLCAICKQPESRKRLAVDHCHKTNKVRGLLCQKCNRGIGFFDDNIARMQAAITYLEVE